MKGLVMWLIFVVTKVGATWEQLKERCRRGHFHPSVLFYERVESGSPLPSEVTLKYSTVPGTQSNTLGRSGRRPPKASKSSTAAGSTSGGAAAPVMSAAQTPMMMSGPGGPMFVHPQRMMHPAFAFPGQQMMPMMNMHGMQMMGAPVPIAAPPVVRSDGGEEKGEMKKEKKERKEKKGKKKERKRKEKRNVVKEDASDESDEEAEPARKTSAEKAPVKARSSEDNVPQRTSDVEAKAAVARQEPIASVPARTNSPAPLQSSVDRNPMPSRVGPPPPALLPTASVDSQPAVPVGPLPPPLVPTPARHVPEPLPLYEPTPAYQAPAPVRQAPPPALPVAEPLIDTNFPSIPDEEPAPAPVYTPAVVQSAIETGPPPPYAMPEPEPPAYGHHHHHHQQPSVHRPMSNGHDYLTAPHQPPPSQSATDYSASELLLASAPAVPSGAPSEGLSSTYASSSDWNRTSYEHYTPYAQTTYTPQQTSSYTYAHSSVPPPSAGSYGNGYAHQQQTTYSTPSGYTPPSSSSIYSHELASSGSYEPAPSYAPSPPTSSGGTRGTSNNIAYRSPVPQHRRYNDEDQSDDSDDALKAYARAYDLPSLRSSGSSSSSSSIARRTASADEDNSTSDSAPAMSSKPSNNYLNLGRLMGDGNGNGAAGSGTSGFSSSTTSAASTYTPNAGYEQFKKGSTSAFSNLSSLLSAPHRD